MPLLGGLFVGLFSGLVDFFVKYVTKKTAFAAAAVATFAVLTVAFYAAISLALVGIAYSFPGGGAVAIGVWLVVPDNAPACLSAIVGVDTAVGLYRWNLENMRLAAYVT